MVTFTDAGNTLRSTKQTRRGRRPSKKKVSAVEGLPIEGSEKVYLKFTDNKRAKFGTDADLHIYHEDGVGNVINSYTSNAFKIFTNGNTEILTNNAETCAKFVKNGAVELYYDNSKKIETTTDGIEVTGAIFASGKLDVPDNAKLMLGTGDDLQLYHDGSHSYILHKTGNLAITAKADETNRRPARSAITPGPRHNQRKNAMRGFIPSSPQRA